MRCQCSEACSTSIRWESRCAERRRGQSTKRGFVHI